MAYLMFSPAAACSRTAQAGQRGVAPAHTRRAALRRGRKSISRAIPPPAMPARTKRLGTSMDGVSQHEMSVRLLPGRPTPVLLGRPASVAARAPSSPYCASRSATAAHHATRLSGASNPRSVPDDPAPRLNESTEAMPPNSRTSRSKSRSCDPASFAAASADAGSAQPMPCLLASSVGARLRGLRFVMRTPEACRGSNRTTKAAIRSPGACVSVNTRVFDRLPGGAPAPPAGGPIWQHTTRDMQGVAPTCNLSPCH
eukprot:scaffold35843_cov90-Isochrysis_galbana.AAC.2